MEEARPIAPEEISDRTLLRHPVAKKVLDGISRNYPDRRVTLDTWLERDFGFDSVDWLNLTLEVERSIGVTLTDKAVVRTTTIRDLLREIVRLAAAGTTFHSFLDVPEEHLSVEQKRWLNSLTPRESWFATSLYRLNQRLLRNVFRLRVAVLDIVPRGQVIFAPTHGSFLDSFAVAAALDRDCLARTFWAADKNLAFGNPLSRRVSRLGQAFPFDAEHGFIAGMASAAAVLKGGYSLVWFPEGWRSRTTAMQEFKLGIGLLLKHHPAPVMPIAIRGAHEAFPPGRILPRPRPVAIGIGEPLDPFQLEREGDGATTEIRIVAALRQHTAELYEEVGRLFSL